MGKRLDTNLVVALLLIDLLLTVAALYLAQVVRFALPYGETLTASQVSLPLIVYGIVSVIWLVTLVAFVYQPRRLTRLTDELSALTLAVMVATLVLAGAFYLSFRDVSRLLFIYFGLIDLYLLIGAHLCFRAVRLLADRERQNARVLIVGAESIGCEVAERLLKQTESKVTIVGYLDDDPARQGCEFASAPVLGRLEDASQLIAQHNIDEVVFTLSVRDHENLSRLALELQRLPVRVWVVPDYFELALARTRLVDLNGIPMIGLREPAIDGVRHVAKRIFDVAVSTLGLLLVSPILLLIAIAIKLDSPGPVIYKQQRVGENCRLFWMYKFRSMRVDADKLKDQIVQVSGDGAVIHKVKSDPRVTRVGRIIRRTSLDELPQLVNVLKGDMSLVGPRPEMPWLVDQYAAWQRKRFAVPPGITGWWQVNGRSDRPMHLHTEDDLYYIQNYSLWLDLHIMFKTIGAVVRGKGAY